MKITFPIIFCLFLIKISAQDTFSIVAVDQETGEVGSAGASCINGSIIISDVHPGVGAIHTQSYWNAQNQNNASQLMDQGYPPMFIIQYLIENDSQDNPTIRQYGIVDLVEGGRSAAYTGENCYDYKDHILGDTYSIQGNILLGPEVLDSMEVLFLNTPGSLAVRLMAAMQGAKIPGADSRCLEDGISSLSAFIRVAKPTNDTDSLYLHLNVNSTPPGVDPIDTLQDLFDLWYEDHPDVITITLENHTGWNLVGLPLEVEDASYNILFPESIGGTLYSFDEGYNLELDLMQGVGYWLRFNDAGNTTISGSLINELIVSLNEGWNLITGPSNSTNLFDIQDPYGLIISETVYGFTPNGYSEAEVLDPGKGYWIRANNSGDIILISE